MFLLIQANKLVKYLMIKDYKKIPIKRSGRYPMPCYQSLLCGHHFAYVPHPPAVVGSSISTERDPDWLPSARLGQGVQLWVSCSTQVASPTPPPSVDMLKDVIREYDEHFPEIIERATYTLEKVGEGMRGCVQ
jgi:hypothetical protein